jgi:uncharacterized protein involved in exopolysaccharide biosynthesis
MQTETILNPLDYVSSLKRRAPLILGLGLPVVAVAAVLAVSLPDVFVSSATFDLVADTTALPGTAARNVIPDQYVYSLTDRVKRSPLLREIVAETRPYPDLADQPDAAVGRLSSDISVTLTSESVLGGGGRVMEARRGFRVQYENDTPDAAFAVASQLVTAFQSEGRAADLEKVQHDVKFFTAEAERTRAQIAEQEERLADFKERNYDALPELSQANINLRGQAERELDNVDREIRTLNQNRIFLVQQLQQAQAGPGAGNLRALEDEYARKSAVYAPGHPDLIALRRQIDSLRATGPTTGAGSLQGQLDAKRAELAEARQRYSDEHPDIRRLTRDIEGLEARIASGDSAQPSSSGQTVLSVQLQTQLNSVDTQIRGLQERGAQLRATMARLEARLVATPEIEREYQAITSGLSTARQRYEQMVGKRMDAEAAAAAVMGGAVDRFVLVDPPTRPSRPAGPARARIMVLGFVIAFMLAAAATFAVEFLDNGVRGSRDIRNLLGVTPLAVVPEIRNSVFMARRKRRLTMYGASVLVGLPVIYGIVHLMAIK